MQVHLLLLLYLIVSVFAVFFMKIFFTNSYLSSQIFMNIQLKQGFAKLSKKMSLFFEKISSYSNLEIHIIAYIDDY